MGATGPFGPTGLKGVTGAQGIGGTTGPQGVARSALNWTISQYGGLAPAAYIVYYVLDSFTIEKIAVSLADSGFAGSNATIFEFYVLPSGSLPASPPSGSGVTSVILPAVGVGNMNAITKDVNISLVVNQILVISVSSAPTTPGNFAQISLRISV
jgi:hypothetical protein